MLEMDEDTQPTGKDVFGEKGNQTVTAQMIKQVDCDCMVFDTVCSKGTGLHTGARGDNTP